MNMAFAESKENLSDAIRIIDEAKTKAEYNASRIKGIKSRISDKQYQRSASLYVDASSAFNAWIKQVQAELDKNDIYYEFENYKQNLNIAERKAMVFMDYSDGLLNDPELGPSDWLKDMIGSIVDAGIKIWREIMLIKEKDIIEREKTKKILKDLEWREFSTLTPQ